MKKSGDFPLRRICCDGTFGNSVQNYDIFKWRLRDGLRAKCVKFKNDRIMIKKRLEHQIAKTEKKLSSGGVLSQEQIQKFSKDKEKLLEIEDIESKAELRKIKNLFFEVNEGNPKTTRKLVTSLNKRAEKKE